MRRAVSAVASATLLLSVFLLPGTATLADPSSSASAQTAVRPAKKDRMASNASASPSRAEKPGDYIWADPGNVASLDFVSGPGGVKNTPKPPFEFIEEDMGGSNPKLKVTDANGTKWGVKFGTEVNAEVFASRIAWASGYYVEPAYFVKSGKINNVTGLTRAKKHVSSDGSFSDARFELKDKRIGQKLKDEQGWRWDTNPFVGKHELNGLKILLMLTSNWDSKDQRDASRGSNTAIFIIPVTGGDQRWYVFSDWGGSMGKWGGVFGREKWDAKGFASQTSKFVTGASGSNVEFGYSGQRTKDVKDGITVEDVRWILQYVGQITDQQIKDGLEAAGATPEEVDVFSRSIRDRINQLKRAAGQ
jgi:hypothetical protein